HRGLVPGAGPAALPRDHVDLEHDGLPGTPARHPLPPRAGRPAGAAYPERHRGHRPFADRDPRELPGGGRRRRRTAGARALRRSLARRGRRLNRLKRPSPSQAFALGAALVVVGVTYWRSWYGVDLTDESFYVVLPYRFATGARPFVDETTVA